MTNITPNLSTYWDDYGFCFTYESDNNGAVCTITVPLVSLRAVIKKMENALEFYKINSEEEKSNDKLSS